MPARPAAQPAVHRLPQGRPHHAPLAGAGALPPTPRQQLGIICRGNTHAAAACPCWHRSSPLGHPSPPPPLCSCWSTWATWRMRRRWPPTWWGPRRRCRRRRDPACRSSPLAPLHPACALLHIADSFTCTGMRLCRLSACGLTGKALCSVAELKLKPCMVGTPYSSPPDATGFLPLPVVVVLTRSYRADSAWREQCRDNQLAQGCQTKSGTAEGAGKRHCWVSAES